MNALTSDLLAKIPGVQHGFGTLREPVPHVFAPVWPALKPDWKQVHGASCAEVTSTNQLCGDVDALYTQKRAIPIAVVTADCVPILMARKDGGAVAAIHAGWRGTRARILQVLWKELRARGEDPKQWVAAIGPSIGPCCYEVSEELAADFAQEFASAGKGVAVPKHRILDLPATNAWQLREIGLAACDLIRACTRCTTGPNGQPAFHSYRREGGKTRQWSMIMASSGHEVRPLE